MIFVNVLQALNTSSELRKRQLPEFFSFRAQRLVQFFLLPLLILAVIVLSTPASHATVAGTHVALSIPDMAYTGVPSAVGSGVELDASMGNGNIQVDVNPGASTITIDMSNNASWDVSSIELVFSGGALTHFTSISRTGGNVPLASQYTASVSSKTITLNVPFGQYENGTVVFSFSSLPAAPQITGHPANSTIATGANATFNVTADNATGYHWQVSTDSGISFNNIANGPPYSGSTTATSATLNITGATAGMNGYQYRAVATGLASPDATSNAATLTVQNPALITGHPAHRTITAGDATSFGVTAANATGYQWQVNMGAGFTNITNGAPYSDANTPTLSITGASGAMNGYQYRVVVSGVSPATSSPAILTVHKATPTVTLTASTNTPASGQNVTFTATLTGGVSPTGTVTYRSGGTLFGSSPISTGGVSTFSTLVPLGDGVYSMTAEYVGDSNNASATSPAITVTVGQGSPVLTSISPNSGTTAGMTSVTLTGANLSGATAVTFGGTPATDIVVNSPSSVTVRTPAHAAGAVTVEITTPGGTAAFINGFTYNLSSATVASVAVPAGGTYKIDDIFNFSVNFSSPVDVTGTPQLGLTMSSPRNASYVSGSGTTTLTFSYTIAEGDLDANGISVGMLGLNGGTIQASGTSANLTLNNVGSTVGVLVDGIRPVVSSITTQAGAQPSATSVDFAVVFSEAITGVDTSDFTFTTTGTAGGTASAISGSGSTYNVTVSGIAGSGTIRLDTATAANIVDAAGNEMRTVFTSGTVHTVSPAAPTVTLSTSNANPAFGTSVTLTATVAGGAAPTGTVTFMDGATALGTSTVSGSTATFSTSVLTVGSHSITAVYGGDANNGASTSSALTVTVGKAAPTISLSASDNNPTLGDPVTFTATLSGGLSPTGTITLKKGATTLVTAGAGPSMSLSTTSLSLGAHLITAEYGGDANNAPATSVAVIVTVRPAVTFLFTPADGSVLKPAMAGEDYSQPIVATGGPGPQTYRLVSGTLPDGVVVNASTGELTGPLAASAQVKTYSFGIEVRNGSGATGTASYTLEVKERIVSVTDKTGALPPANVNLEEGATGGPFGSADIIFVEPSNAGTASIVRGELAAVGPTPLGWYLKFIPNPGYSGTAKVGFRLTSALGASNTGIVTFALRHDEAKVKEDIDNLVRGFVQTRQGLIASTIKLPGLLDRRRMATSADPVTSRMQPSQDGIMLGYATSLAQLAATRSGAAGVTEPEQSRFNAWVDGTFMAHKGDDSSSKWGSFGMISAGADYLVSDTALIGLSFHYDRMTDPTDADAELTGNGWLAGPYLSMEIGKGVMWDTSLLYGGSANDIDTTFWDGSFDTTRWMLDTSISGQWMLDDVTTLTPKLRAVYFSEAIDDYAVESDGGDTIAIDGFDQEQFRVSLGAELSRSFTMDNGMALTPRLGLTGGFAGLDGTGAFGSLSVGLALQTVQNWSIDGELLFDIEGEGQKSAGAKAGISSRF